jgi:hypothetical protein
VRIPLLFLFAASVIALPAPLLGQARTCAHADSVLRSDERGRQERIEAIGKLLDCADTRVSAFTALLRRAQPGSVGDTLGRIATWYLFDPRFVDSVAVLSKDARQSRERRLLYLGLLTRYSDCSTAVDTHALDEPMATVTVGGTDMCGSDDLHPLPAADRDRARAAVAWMGRNDPDDRLRALAAQVSEELDEIFTAKLQRRSRPN